MIFPIFLPNLGCNPRCIYCDQSYITERKGYPSTDDIKKALSQIKSPCEVGIYGGDVLRIEKERLEEIFATFSEFDNKILKVRISTRPKEIDRYTEEVIELLRGHKVNVIELGIPTFNDSILKFLNRGHTVSNLVDMYGYLRKKGFGLALQVMVGLPFEEREDVRETVRRIITLRPDYVRIYPLVVMKGTPLAQMLSEGTLKLADFQEILRRTAYIYAHLKRNGIEVLKIGLTDNESLKKNLLGGFYHPSFGYLVRCLIFLEALRWSIQKFGIRGRTTIVVNRREVPHVYGYKGGNISVLREIGMEPIVLSGDLEPYEFLLTDETQKPYIRENVLRAITEIGDLIFWSSLK